MGSLNAVLLRRTWNIDAPSAVVVECPSRPTSSAAEGSLEPIQRESWLLTFVHVASAAVLAILLVAEPIELVLFAPTAVIVAEFLHVRWLRSPPILRARVARRLATHDARSLEAFNQR